MNLHLTVRGAITSVNPDTPGQWYRSTGYATGGDGTQAPTYAAPVTLPMQVQPLTGKDLKKLEGLNIQGITRTVFVNANVQGVDREAGQGGDLICFADVATVPPDLRGTWWLCTTVLDTWGVGWCKVGLTKQLTGPA